MSQAATGYGTGSVRQKDKHQNYFSIIKPGITFLVVLTTFPSVLINSVQVDIALLIGTCLGTGLLAASAAIFNQIVDAEIDLEMNRTRHRVLPKGELSRTAAFGLGTASGIGGGALLLTTAHPLAFFIALAGHVFYIFVYTLYLKKRTPQNIVIGGISGAVGPLIGAAAVNGTIDLTSWMLFLLIFLWTPPHFWALALKYKDDYAAANIPMYPVVYGNNKTRAAILYYTLTLLIPVAVIIAFGNLGWIFAVVAIGATAKFIQGAWTLHRQGDRGKALDLFSYSCIYALLMFCGVIVDWLVRSTILS